MTESHNESMHKPCASVIEVTCTCLLSYVILPLIHLILVVCNSRVCHGDHHTVRPSVASPSTPQSGVHRHIILNTLTVMI